MISPCHWPRVAATVLRTYGVRGAALRGRHELRRTRGRFRAGPSGLDVGVTRPSAHAPFAVDAARLRAATDVPRALERAALVRDGRHQAYRWEWRSLPSGDGWHVNPLTGFRYDPALPWWKIQHLVPAAGDIKDVWEPARFGWMYDLVRGWLLTGDDAFAAAAHERLADFDAANPAFRGVHWSCGQETAIRAVALLFMETSLDGAPSTTDAARARLARVLSASAERIADAIDYGISQRNNHGISEATGLVALGVRFAGMHPDAGSWLDRGRRELERLIDDQFGRDGWYAQHSFTYLRLALDQCLVAERALRSVGTALSAPARARLHAAVSLLIEVVDGSAGIVPNHGANDGAFVLPVTTRDYRDFRPLLTAACATWGVAMPEDVGRDEEPLAWLDLASPAAGPARVDGVVTGSSGWAVVRRGPVHLFLRAGRYTSRPSHLDPLQLDVRLDGHEVIVDAGTFAYMAPRPWRNGLASARVHNGPLLDLREPGVRGPRFLWLLWPEARIRSARSTDAVTEVVSEVPATVRRTVSISAGEVHVRDEALRAGAALSVRWLLHPEASARIAAVPDGAEHAAAEGEVTGWFSPHYGERVASRVIIIEQPATASPSVIVTRIASGR